MTEPKTELQRIAISRQRDKELETYQRAVDMEWLNDRMEDGRMGRCLSLIKREAEMERDFKEKTDHAAIVNSAAAFDTAIGKEIATVRREEACKLLRRHYLRERDPSLRQVIQKLEAGYVCRDLKQQMLNNEFRRRQEKATEVNTNRVVLQAQGLEERGRDKAKEDVIKIGLAYGVELRGQLVMRQIQKQCEYEETLIEKKMLDDIMRTLADEDKREKERRRDEKHRLQYEMVASQQAREAWRQKQTEVLLKEERAIEEQIKAMGDRSLAIIEARNLKNRLREEANQRMGDKILADEAVREERRNIIKQLQEQEYLEKNCQDDLAEKLKVERTKQDTKEALTEQMQSKKREVLRQKETDLKLRIETAVKIKEQDDKELEKERKVKERRRKYADELKKQIEDNAVRRKKETEIEAARAQAVWDHDKNWRAEVADERKVLIEEHVPHLLGCLAAGVVHKDDIPTVKQGLAKHDQLSNIDITPMTITRKNTIRPKCNDQCKILREY